MALGILQILVTLPHTHTPALTHIKVSSHVADISDASKISARTPGVADISDASKISARTPGTCLVYSHLRLRRVVEVADHICGNGTA